MSLQEARLAVTELLRALRRHEADLVETYAATPLDISARSVIARVVKEKQVDVHVVAAIAMANGIADSGSPIAPAAIVNTVYAAHHIESDGLTAIGLEDLRATMHRFDLDQGFSRALASYAHGLLTEDSYVTLAKMSFMPGTVMLLIADLRRAFIDAVANIEHVYPLVGTKIKLDLIKNSNYLDKLRELPWIQFK